VAEVAGEHRHRDADYVGDGLGMPGKPERGEHEMGKADADEPHLRDRGEVERPNVRDRTQSKPRASRTVLAADGGSPSSSSREEEIMTNRDKDPFKRLDDVATITRWSSEMLKAGHMPKQVADAFHRHFSGQKMSEVRTFTWDPKAMEKGSV
jgi:hypothetical protein